MSASHRLPAGVRVLERGWLSSNNVLFVGQEKTAVVDTGYVTHAPQTLALLEDALAGRPLDQLLNTHLHSDHCGGNAALQQRYPAIATHLPPGEAALVERWDEEGLSFRATGQTCPRFRVDALLEPGRTIVLGDLPWEIHAAKGHDPHSIILFEPESRTLISADALWEKGFGIVFPELAGEPSFEEVAATLDLIEHLGPLRVIPGHGGVFESVSAALAIARSRLEGFIDQPARHARHALKVLLKFKLLEVQAIERQAWNGWVSGTPYIETVRARFFASHPLDALCAELLDELIHIGVASVDGSRILNR